MRTPQEVQETYVKLAPAQRQRFLCRLLYCLTEAARGSYPEAGAPAAAAIRELRALNECVHTISKQVLDAMNGGTRKLGVSDEVVVLVALENLGLAPTDIIPAELGKTLDRAFWR